MSRIWTVATKRIWPEGRLLAENKLWRVNFRSWAVSQAVMFVKSVILLAPGVIRSSRGLTIRFTSSCKALILFLLWPWLFQQVSVKALSDNTPSV